MIMKTSWIRFENKNIKHKQLFVHKSVALLSCAVVSAASTAGLRNVDSQIVEVL